VAVAGASGHPAPVVVTCGTSESIQLIPAKASVPSWRPLRALQKGPGVASGTVARGITHGQPVTWRASARPPTLRHMPDFFKRMFQSQDPTPSSPRADPPREAPFGLKSTDHPASEQRDERLTARYFELSTAIERARVTGDYPTGIRAARETYPLLRAFVEEWVRDSGDFSIVTSHAVHTASGMMAVMGERDGIAELRGVLEGVPELHVWLPVAEEAERDADLVEQALVAVAANPGLRQTALKRAVGTEDGRRIATLLSWMEKAGRLRRVKDGATKRLYPAGYSVAAETTTPYPTDGGSGSGSVVTSGQSREASRPPASPPHPAASDKPIVRRTRPPQKARPLDLGSLPYLRLPKAPLRWEARQEAENQRTTEVPPTAAPSADPAAVLRTAPQRGSRFVVAGEGWHSIKEEKLAAEDRPNPAYKDAFHTAGSTYWLDPKGHRVDFPDAAAVLRVTDRDGTLVTERGLAYDAYRSDVNTDGSAILFLSREGVLHGYSDHLEPILTDQVANLPEYQAQTKRLGIEQHELKNHLRCVAISADHSWYLVTVVDEAWCLSTAAGDVRWGLRFPIQDGWSRVALPRSDRIGTASEIETALKLMELSLPVTPQEITRQYRALAMRWHPDRNPGDPLATARFQELGAAVNLLVGIDLGGLEFQEVERVTYERILKRQHVDIGGALSANMTLSMVTGEKQAADWIYAANAGMSGDRAFLAAYSGKIVEVTGPGIPVRVIDIGAVPRQIIETTEHLYILTDTRLYVLAGERLEALVDVFEAGDLIVGASGFGLLQAKGFSWYSPTGRVLGMVQSKDPIRRVVSSALGLVIETRQHRLVVEGANVLW
jgi:hypothetical protein